MSSKDSTQLITSRNGQFLTANRIPLEIFDLIAAAVDSKRDLISFALASRACKALIIPRHSEYRLVRCQLSSNVWSHLLARRDLVRNIRVLDLLSNHPTSALRQACVPSSLEREATSILKGGDDDEEKFDSLLEALGCMDLLQHFSWSTDFQFGCPMERNVERKIWAFLQHCTSLRHVGYSEPFFFRSFNGSENFRDSSYPLWSISNLTSISFCNNPFLWDRHCGPHFLAMLQSSPDLEVLYLQLDHRNFHVHGLFTKCRWPHLRKVTLKLFADTRLYASDFALFLDAHPTLVKVEWQYLPPAPLKSKSLPNLRHLRGTDDNDGVLEILGNKIDPPRRIESLGDIPLNPQYLHALENIDGNRLRKLELRFFDSLNSIRRISQMFPQLKWLRIPSVDYQHDSVLATYFPIHLGEWSDVLPRFSNLEVFHGVSFFKDPGGEHADDNEDRATHILSLAPKLRRVDHWDADSEKVIVLSLEENEDGHEFGVWKVVIIADGDDEDEI